MEERKIWKKYADYTFFRPYIQWTFRTCYSKVSVIDADKIPDAAKASVIFATNHCNTLMDALTLLQSRKEPTAFVARADIFKKPFFAHILNNLRILPIYRQRDCADSTAKNVEIFAKITECVNNGMAFAIFPEGTHRTRRSMLPLRRGTMHAAQLALQSNPERPVYVVPAGITYEDYFNLMRPVTIKFGDPIPIKDGCDSQEMTNLLASRMSELFVCFPDDENLAANEKAYEQSVTPHYGFLHWILAVLLLPLFVLAGFLCLPMLLATLYLKKGLKDMAWINTMRFASKLALTPFTVAGALIAGLIHLPWYFAIALAVLTLYAHPVFYRILIFYKLLLRSNK